MQLCTNFVLVFDMGLTSLPPIWTMSLNILFFWGGITQTVFNDLFRTNVARTKMPGQDIEFPMGGWWCRIIFATFVEIFELF